MTIINFGAGNEKFRLLISHFFGFYYKISHEVWKIRDIEKDLKEFLHGNDKLKLKDYLPCYLFHKT